MISQGTYDGSMSVLRVPKGCVVLLNVCRIFKDKTSKGQKFDKEGQKLETML